MSGLRWRTAIAAAPQVVTARHEHDDRAEHELRRSRSRHAAEHRARAPSRSRAAAPSARSRASRRARSVRDLVALGARDRGEPRLRRRVLVASSDDRRELRSPRRGSPRPRRVRSRRGSIDDPRARQRQVDLGARDARHRRDRALDPTHACRARHAEHGRSIVVFTHEVLPCVVVITTLRITGMTCNGCVRHVDKALRACPG